MSSFVGREREVAEIVACLDASRLVTLTGPGGVGKTRLALQVAGGLRERFPDGVWFLELAALSDAALVTLAVARALGVAEPPDRPLLETLVERLQQRRLLLVLDNCEHLIEACVQLAEALLQSCGELSILATSRQSLGITGETAWRVPPLSLPAERREARGERREAKEGTDSPSLVSRLSPLASEAVRLFVERGTAASRSFALTPSNAESVVEICRRLDGIPLAIELAAARLKALTVNQIAAHLTDRFRLLTGGSRTSLPRQQTLRATMDWSYGLLTEPERALLRRLSVFAGGFTLEAAEGVCSDCGLRIPDCGSSDRSGTQEPPVNPSPIRNPQSAIRNEDVLDLLTALVDKSLVVAEEQRGRTRYRLLETVRQYSWEKLAEAGETDELQARHRDWFLTLAERAAPELLGAEQTVWLERLEQEHDNFRAAFEWTLGPPRGVAGCQLSVVSCDVGLGTPIVSSSPSPTDNWQLATDHSPVPSTLHPTPYSLLPDEEGAVAVRFGAALGRYLYVRGHFTEGRQWLERALAASRPSVTPQRGSALYAAAVLCHEQGRYAAAHAFEEESLAIWRQLGDRRSIAASLDQLGHILNALSEYDRATALFEESLALWREAGDKAGAAAALNALGWLAAFHGDYARAEALCGESLDLRREMKNLWGMAYSLEFLTQMAVEQGDFDRAEALAGESLALRQQLGDQRGIAASLLNLGHIARNRHDVPAARLRYEESSGVWQELSNPHGIAQSLEGLAEVASMEGEHARAAGLYRQGLRVWQGFSHKAGTAQCLEGLAAVAVAQRQPARAARLLGAAQALRAATGMPVVPARRAATEQLQAKARAEIGEAAFHRAWAEGHALPLEKAIAAGLEECT